MSETAQIDATLTPAAEQFIRRMLRFAKEPEAGFRLKIRPGGCSGFSAEFDLAASPATSEVVWDQAGPRIFLDPTSCMLLNGSVVDFLENRSHTGFSITTPGTAGLTCSSAPTLVGIESLSRR
jgi:iron-sulfur cluster assembly accessory protein